MSFVTISSLYLDIFTTPSCDWDIKIAVINVGSCNFKIETQLTHQEKILIKV